MKITLSKQLKSCVKKDEFNGIQDHFFKFDSRSETQIIDSDSIGQINIS